MLKYQPNEAYLCNILEWDFKQCHNTIDLEVKGSFFRKEERWITEVKNRLSKGILFKKISIFVKKAENHDVFYHLKLGPDQDVLCIYVLSLGLYHQDVKYYASLRYNNPKEIKETIDLIREEVEDKVIFFIIKRFMQQT